MNNKSIHFCSYSFIQDGSYDVTIFYKLIAFKNLARASYCAEQNLSKAITFILKILYILSHYKGLIYSLSANSNDQFSLETLQVVSQVYNCLRRPS